MPTANRSRKKAGTSRRSSTSSVAGAPHPDTIPSTKNVGGLDENGYGSLAGPLVVTVYVTEGGAEAPCLIEDSKKTSHSRREEAVPILLEACKDVATGRVEANEIDLHGAAWAWKTACRRALRQLHHVPHILYVDGDHGLGFKPRWLEAEYAIPRADDQIWQVAAASNIGKLMRDGHMLELHEDYPAYQWHNNKGYGTAAHREAIGANGLTPEHRRKYCRNMVKK